MPNIFLNLPLPAGDGAGTSVDTSAMGGGKTLTIGGEFEGATIAIEASTDGGTVFQPVALFSAPGTETINVAANRLRTFVSGRSSLAFTANADVSANDLGGDFVGITMPAGNGAGASVDISALESLTTVVVGGDFEGASINIEVSGDGADFTPLMTFASPGAQTIPQLIANFVRVVVSGRSNLPFTATASMGATKDSASSEITSPLVLATGNGTATGNATEASMIVAHLPYGGDATASGEGSAIIGKSIGGTGLLEATGNGSFVHGEADADFNGPSTIRASSNGCFAGGWCSEGEIVATYVGALAHGVAQGGGTLDSNGNGSTAFGRANGDNARIEAASSGGFATGWASAATGTNRTAEIRATQAAAFAMGNVTVTADNGTSEIRASGIGAFAMGRVAESTGADAGVISSGNASFAFGRAVDAEITASNDASVAMGYAATNGITSSGEGSFAQGKSDTGSIAATADNSVQFGPGTNALADTVQIGGAGIRFKGTTGAPAAPQNGDMWVDGTDVVIRSGGVSVIIA